MNKTILLKDSDLSIVKITEIIKQLDLKEQLIETDQIIIKPNLTGGTHYHAHSGAVTSLSILNSIIEAVASINPHADISIVESDSPGGGFTSKKFQFQGYDALVETFPQIKLLDLTRTEHIEYPYEGVFFKKTIILSDVFEKPHFFISLGKIKTHHKVGYTGALKNQYGCFPPLDKSIYHPVLPQVISDINRFIRPDLSILDGCPAMEGNGPLKGTPVECGIIAFSNNPVLLDEMLAHRTGLYRYTRGYIDYCKESLSDVYPMEGHQILNDHLLDKIPKLKFISQHSYFKIRLGLFIERIAFNLNRLSRKIQQ